MTVATDVLSIGVVNPPLFEATAMGIELGSASRATVAKIVLPHPGRCPKTPTHTILDFDNSGSVTNGNDTIGRRYEEARLAIEKVGRCCRCRNEIVSVVHFDTPTSGDVRAAPIAAGLDGEIGRGLAIPPDGGGISELGPSLVVARRLAAEHPRHLSVLVVLSDFELFDLDVAMTLSDLCDFPGLVFAVALRAAPPPQLLADQRVNVVRVTYDSPPGTVARAVFDALTAQRVPRSSSARRSRS